MSNFSRGLVCGFALTLSAGAFPVESLDWYSVRTTSEWGSRVNFSLDSFQDALVLIGGSLGASTTLHHQDVWVSTSGDTWNRVAAHAPWTARREHVTLAFDNKLWLLGGRTYADEFDPTFGRARDVWVSADGANWEFVTDAPWATRNRHAGVVFNGRMWILGGAGDDGYLRDVWSSADGIQWVEATSAAPWSARFAPCLVVFDEKMWLLGGGRGPNPDANDIWSSVDGVQWTQEQSQAAWSPRRGHSVVAYADRLWLLGGRVFNQFNSSEIWVSDNARDWQLSTANAPWGRRSVHACAVHDGLLWFMGGEEFLKENRMSDVWFAQLAELEPEGAENEGEEGEGEPAGDSLRIRLATTTPSYTAGALVEMSMVLEGNPGAPLTALGAQIFLPAEWAFAGVLSGEIPSVLPETGQTGTLEFAYFTPPALPAHLSFQVYVPVPQTGPKLAGGIGLYRTSGAQNETPFTVLQYQQGAMRFHSADTDADGRFSLSEVLRVVQIYNSSAYHCSPGSEDGYAPGPGPVCDAPHDSDFNPTDWRIGLGELLRMIQFYNSGGYHACADGEDGFCPR